jgi:protein-disulfide isomerase
LDMGRTHGTVSTAMGSPILGDTSAPITIVEFGDYQCHQCFNWFHNTKHIMIYCIIPKNLKLITVGQILKD